MVGVERALEVAVDLAWGMPLLLLLVVGGLALTIYSRLLPFRACAHSFDIIRG